MKRLAFFVGLGLVAGAFLAFAKRALRSASPPAASSSSSSSSTRTPATSTRTSTSSSTSAPNSAGGLLLAAVRAGTAEEPEWVEVQWPAADVVLEVGAHTLRARTPAGELVRLPVSWRDTVEIARLRNWAPLTAEVSDLIWRAAPVKLEPTTEPADSTMASVAASVHDDADLEREIAGRSGLAADEGKDWILSPRLLVSPDAAVNYGMRSSAGKPIQQLGSDSAPTKHNAAHYDYSQRLRPLKRYGRRISDGSRVDLLELYVARGLPRGAIPLALTSNPNA